MKMKKKGYAMGGMKKKGYAEGGKLTQEQINDPTRAVAAGDRMSEMRAKEAAMGKKKPKKRPTAPMTSMRPKPRPATMSAKPAVPMGMKAGGMKKKGYAAGGMKKKGKAKGGKTSVRGAGIAQRGVRPAQMR